MRSPMWFVVAVLCVVAGTPSVALAQGGVDVRWERNGVVRVSQGRNVSRIDLSKDISGCLGRVFDGSTNERFGSGLHKTHVFDVTSRDGQHFLLVGAVAAPNCNVQGQCGAGDDDVTLIWLHAGADLALVRKQVFAVEDCVYARWVEGLPDDWSSNLKLTAGLLMFNFTETVYDPDAGKSRDFSGQAIYDRQSASDGIRITRVPK
jgi:hypothetical protein